MSDILDMESIYRQEAIVAFKTDKSQSKRGQLFEILADITDEDGACAEIEDWGDLADLLGDIA